VTKGERRRWGGVDIEKGGVTKKKDRVIHKE